MDLALEIMGADAFVPNGRRPFKHFRTDEPGAAELDRIRGSTCSSSTLVAEPSTPVPRRSSATSSERPCWVFLRSHDREPAEEAVPQRHAGLGEVVHVGHVGDHHGGDVMGTRVAEGFAERIGRDIDSPKARNTSW